MAELYPEVFWHEGLMLRPHHLQALQRQCQGLLSHHVHTRPFSYGIRALKVAEAAIPDFVFELETCDLIMPDGTPVILGQNAEVSRVNFQEFKTFDGDSLDVYLAIPGRNETSPGVIDREGHDRGEGTGMRYVSLETPRVFDENHGDNPQRIGFKRLRVETVIGTRPPKNYTTPLKIAELRRVVLAADLDPGKEPSSFFELSDRFQPASLSILASPQLKSVLRDLYHKLRTTNTELTNLRHEYRAQKLESAIDLLRLQVTNSVLPVAHQLLSQPLMHPFDVYMQLLRLAGDLAIFSDFDPPDLPTYNHDDPLPAFEGLRGQWLKQLESVAQPAVESDAMVTGEHPSILDTELRAEHIDPSKALHISILTDCPVEELEQSFRAAIFKAGNPQLITDPTRRFEHVECRVDPKLPARMTDRTGIAFLKVIKSGDHWADAVAAKRFGIAGLDPDAEPRLHVTEPKTRGRA